MINLLKLVQVFILYFQGDKALGMIGGADGPTAVFIASKGPSFNQLLLSLVIITGIVLYFKKARN